MSEEKLIIPINKDEFKRKVTVKVENILDGFNSYNNKIITGEDFEKNFIDFMYKAYKANNKKLIVDFYIKRLNTEGIKILKENLPKDDILILDMLLDCKNVNSNYFEIKDDKVLEFFCRLSTRELFFITYYFYHIPVTIWGNYNYEFPIFYSNEGDFEKYKPLIDSSNLEVHK